MLRYKHRILFGLLIWMLRHAVGQRSDAFCPPQELILPCRCTQKGAEVQVWCSHSDLPRVLTGIKSVAKYVKQPIDEMVLENNQLLSLPNRFFSPLRIVRLMLRNNGVERLAPAWLNELEDSLVEIFIVEQHLRSIPIDSLLDCRSLRAVTIQSDHIKRAPSFARLSMLRYIKIESGSLAELPPYGLANLINLENVHIAESEQLHEVKAGMFENLERLKTLNLNDNGIVWVHLHAFINLPLIHTIDLSGNQIADAGMIGRAVKDLTKLEYLRLDHNNITKLTEGSFVDLPSLKELYLNDNSIVEIHYGAFHKTPRLKLIHLENNYLKRIHPESFFHSSGSGVEYIHVQHNDITEIEEVKSLLDALPMLKFLDVSHNKVQTIPFGILRGHAAIEQLIFDHNWIRLIEQDAFMAMPALRELRLRNNSLTENGILPFWNLPSLKGLDLSWNKFTVLNRMILLGLPSLRRLDISHNQIQSVDFEAFAKNTFIETINISDNEISDIDINTFSILNHLFEIDASFNKLQQFIPGLPQMVERVNLESNQISALPNSSRLALPNLRLLNMGNNLLNEIPGNSLSNLRKLRTLLVDRNQLKTIDEHSFNGLNILETLNLQDNNLIKLHENSLATLPNLRNLNVQGNHLEFLLNNILENPQLKSFDASRNNIMEIQDQFFAKTLRLLSLDLSENRLRELPLSMTSLRDLKEVDISYNRLTHFSSEIINAWHILEEFRASNNNITELPENTFVELPKLLYLDLSSNDIKFINAESIKNLPSLQELVLANNLLTELNHKPFQNLPNLQALHLQKNRLRYISPESFRGSGSLVYLNLSHNDFQDLEHMGLHNARNLEVLDISYNRVRRILTNPLRHLDWLVELKLDNNQICKVQGNPFVSMPRLKVLNLKNNRMASVAEQTFSNLRGNLALLELEGNPLDCSCDMIWLHAWYKQANSYPGPRCRDGVLLTEQRISKSDCDSSIDNHLNQVLLTNDHGDIFKRQLNVDECDIPYQENLPSSPTESEYFEQHYVDYPNGENDPNRTYRPVPGFPHNFNETYNRNRTLLNYNQHRLQQLHHQHNSGSPFTFFGYPLPSLTNLWGGEARKSSSRSSLDSNGKSRLRNFRPRPDELIDDFQFSKATDRFHEERPPPPPGQHVSNNVEFNQYRPNDFGLVIPSHNIPPNQVEKGGFIPMLPGYKGFTPIKNPYLEEENETEAVTEKNEENPHSNPDSLANESMHVHGNKEESLDDAENKFPLRVSTIAPSDVRYPLSNTSLLNAPNITSAIEIKPTTPPPVPPTLPPTLSPRSPILSKPSKLPQKPKEPQIPLVLQHIENVQAISKPPPAPTETPTITEPRPPLLPTVFQPNGSDVINLSKNANKYDGNDTNQSHNRNVLSALVAPGAQQGVFRGGRPTITKVFSTTAPQTQAPILPLAEEYLRTTHAESRNHSFGSYDTTPLAITNNIFGDINAENKGDMDWYYSNYNKTKTRDQMDLSLNRFRSGSGVTSQSNRNSYLVFLMTLISIFIFN